MSNIHSRYTDPDAILAAAAQSMLGDVCADDLDAWFHQTWLNLSAKPIARQYSIISTLFNMMPIGDQLAARKGKPIASLTDPGWLNAMHSFLPTSDLELVLFLYKGMYSIWNHHLDPRMMDPAVPAIWDTIFSYSCSILETRGIDLPVFTQMTHLPLQSTFAEMDPTVVGTVLQKLFPRVENPYARVMALSTAPIYTLLAPEKLDALPIAMMLHATFAQAWSCTVQCSQSNIGELSL